MPHIGFHVILKRLTVNIWKFFTWIFVCSVSSGIKKARKSACCKLLNDLGSASLGCWMRGEGALVYAPTSAGSLLYWLADITSLTVKQHCTSRDNETLPTWKRTLKWRFGPPSPGRFIAVSSSLVLVLSAWNVTAAIHQLGTNVTSGLLAVDLKASQRRHFTTLMNTPSLLRAAS